MWDSGMREAGKEGFRAGGMQDRMNAGQEGCTVVQKRCRTGRMKDWKDAGQE